MEQPCLFSCLHMRRSQCCPLTPLIFMIKKTSPCRLSGTGILEQVVVTLLLLKPQVLGKRSVVKRRKGSPCPGEHSGKALLAPPGRVSAPCPFPTYQEGSGKGLCLSGTRVPTLTATWGCLRKGGIPRPGSKRFTGQSGHKCKVRAMVTHLMGG